MLNCDSTCSQTLTGLSLSLPGAVLCNTTRRLGDRQRVILRQRVRGSVRAVRAVRNTRVLQTETRVVVDMINCGSHRGSPEACSELPMCACVRSAVCSWFEHLPMYLFLCWCMWSHHLYVWIEYPHGDCIVQLYRCVSAPRFNGCKLCNRRPIGWWVAVERSFVFVWLWFSGTQPQ
jgi:hypothetical protein